MLVVKIKNIIKKIIAKNYIRNIFKNNEKIRIILIGSPIHGNLGDHAIAIAEEKMFRQFSEFNFLDIPDVYYCYGRTILKKYINQKDIIVITGGGFIGTLWPEEQEMVNDIIKEYPNNKIIIMPQTFYFSDDKVGYIELEKMQKLVQEHKDIHIFTRDKDSYSFCKKIFKSANTIGLVPDMVLSLNYMESITDRKGVLLCFRSDKEKITDDKILQSLYKKLNELKLSILNTDTVINHRISLKNRCSYFLRKLLDFQKSELVITDRLHGMLFAAITGTPCIAIDNVSHKVKGVYEWLKPLKYIVFVDDFKNINKYIDNVLKCEIKTYNLNIKYKKDFQKIIDVIRK